MLRARQPQVFDSVAQFGTRLALIQGFIHADDLLQRRITDGMYTNPVARFVRFPGQFGQFFGLEAQHALFARHFVRLADTGCRPAQAAIAEELHTVNAQHIAYEPLRQRIDFRPPIRPANRHSVGAYQ